MGQGFIGGAPDGTTTTLGREGSDYSAAVAAHILEAESMAVWKDVDGVLNADPKIFPDAVQIAELNYLDTIELAYSGAQIIHPRTIKPLQTRTSRRSATSASPARSSAASRRPSRCRF